MSKSNYQYLISQNDQNEQFEVWQFDLNNPALISKISDNSENTIPKGYHITQVGNYVLQWSPMSDDNNYAYRLLEFSPNETNALGSYQYGKWSKAAVQSGTWQKKKFFGSRSDFANPTGAKKGFEQGSELVLVSLHNFVLNWIPTAGRGTYQLFNFDAGNFDPLPAPYSPQGAWLTINQGHELTHICGYVLDRNVDTGDYWVWQFDAQSKNPLSFPAVKKGNLNDLGISSNHTLVVIGGHLLAWEPASSNYLVLDFDLKADSGFCGPIKTGKLPESISSGTLFTAVETLIEKDDEKAKQPGTMDFMRDKIEHVIYYMIENRSFDHVCGWLYDQNAPIKVIGPEGPYRGVDPNFTNNYNGKDYPVTMYNNGKLSAKTPDGDPFILDLDHQDPYHDNSDVLRQMFSKNINDYYEKNDPDMGGFAWNNGTEEVMLGYSPEQLPVLNGLAKHFAISDDWFCSMPGGTDVNRAIAFTGSSLGHLNNFQNGVEYTEWSEYPHRPSIWKVLWSNGMRDFKIYNAVEWFNCQFTYNLFLKGQVPTVDSPFNVGGYIPQLNQFYDDLKYGTLPKFAFLEPKWVASAGSTSYHPGNDLIPGERTLKDIFDAIQASPLRDKILLVITFDEHGGIADHVKPPYAVKPYANDSIDGFDFDIMGVRIPTILVSSWISENTVFRSATGTSYDSTSILSTLLEWCGIPKSRWGLGERTNAAPTFEAVIREERARTEKIDLPLPWDSKFPPLDENGNPDPKESGKNLPVHGLHELVVPRMIADLTPNLSRAERVKLEDEVLHQAPNLEELHKRIDALHKKHGGNS